ncbi:hypothetical protein Tco_0050228, partial [Tanacetum coccineum]
MQKESVSRQGRKPVESKPTVHKDLAFDDLDDAIDYMEIEDAYDEGTVKDSKETRVSTEDQVSTDKPKVSTDKPKVSTDKLKVSTDKLKVSTDKPNEGTAEPNEGTAEPNEGTAEPKDGNSDESAAPSTTKARKFLRKKLRVNEAERKFAQLANDEEVAKKVQEEWEVEEEKKMLAEEEATKAALNNEYDFIQAR